MSGYLSGNLITNSNLIFWDASNIWSNTGIGSTIFDLSGNNNVAYLHNVTRSSANTGILSFNGTTSYVINVAPFVGFATSGSVTVNLWINLNSLSTSCLFSCWVYS